MKNVVSIVCIGCSMALMALAIGYVGQKAFEAEKILYNHHHQSNKLQADCIEKCKDTYWDGVRIGKALIPECVCGEK